MHLRLLASVFALFAALVLCCGCRTAPRDGALAHDAPGDAQLAAELDALLELELERDPVWATHLGERRFDARLEDSSEDGAEVYRRRFEAIAERILALDPATLSEAGRDGQWVVASELVRVRAARLCRLERWRVDALSGPQVRFPVLARAFPVRTVDDLETLERRLRATRAAVDGRVTALRAGVASGHVPSRANVERVLAQLEALLATPLEADALLELRDGDGAALDDPEARARLMAVVDEVVRPALRHYRDVLRDEVLAAARNRPGVPALPDGHACYAALLEAHLGAGHDPQALHELGLAQLAAAEAHLVELGAELGMRGSPQTVRAALRETAASSPEALLERAAEAVARADAALGRVVRHLPSGRVRVEAMGAELASGGPLAVYQGAPSGRVARFFVNTHDPQRRVLHLMEALAFHEALPGHHLQDAVAAEATSLHPWRRRLEQTAFVEGWALYAEQRLAGELGLYSGTLARIGRAELLAWRAARLVVDTGIHHLGWSRERAVDFLVAHTWLSRGDAGAEVDRYAAWPGQALAYLVGMRAIESLREEAAATLGPRLDLRAFHDEVLRRGPLPLPLLERRVRAWIALRAAD